MHMAMPLPDSRQAGTEVEILVTPEMVDAGKEAVRDAWDNGDYLDEEAVRVFTAMLAACESPQIRVSVSDLVRYFAK